MSGIYISGVSMPKEGGALCVIIHHDGKVCHFFDLQGERIATAAPVPEHHGPLVDALDVIGTFPDDYVFTNEQARALTNYIIPADPAEEGET